jgi:hypothetical protein
MMMDAVMAKNCHPARANEGLRFESHQNTGAFKKNQNNINALCDIKLNII